MELKVAWDHYMNANDRWKDIEAQKQAKVEIKVCFRDSFIFSSKVPFLLASGLDFLISIIGSEWYFETH